MYYVFLTVMRMHEERERLRERETEADTETHTGRDRDREIQRVPFKSQVFPSTPGSGTRCF